MLTAFCDASGGPDQGIMVVAGWISSVAEWERFDADWRLLLAKYEVPYFHMKEFAHSKGPFESWRGKESKRRTFLSTACEIIRDRVLASLAVGVEYSAFEQVDRLYPLSEAVDRPYCLCSRTCIAETNRWAERHNYPQTHVEYVFERGDEGAGALVDIMPKHLQVPSFKTRIEMTPLQVADFSAWELLKARRSERGDFGPFTTYRQSFLALAAIDERVWSGYGEAELVTLCRAARLPLRSQP